MNKYCISCGEILIDDKNIHKKCIKDIFSVNYMSLIQFDYQQLTFKAQETAGKLSISGIQPKLSVKLNTRKKTLDVVAKNGEFILKPQTNTYPNLPENENLFMTIFNIVNIKTAKHTLIKIGDESIAYIVKRFDRKKNKKIHFEDFQSVLNINNKYEGSVEKIGNAIKRYARFPGLEIQTFLKIIIMNLIIGNGDAHLKNFGFLYDENGEKSLSPCYDILCSKLVIKNEQDSAITIAGKKNKINKKDILNLSRNFGINNKISNNIFQEVFDSKSQVIEFIKDYPFLINEKPKILKIIKEGYRKFQK